MRTKILKGITWNKNWKYYVQSCQRDILSDYPDEKIGIIEIMCQLKDVMSVYDAYLKAIEAVFQRDNCNKNGYGLKKIKDLKNEEIKSLKKGKTDEELSDCIVAATNGYMKWYKMDAPNRQANRQKIIGIRVVSSFLRIVFFVSLFISVALICLGSYSLYQGTYDDLIIELYFDGYSCLICSILLGTLCFGSKFLIATSIFYYSWYDRYYFLSR